MPFRAPAVKSPRQPARMLILLALLAGLMCLGRPARSAEFTDSAGRRVMLPPTVTRVLPADRTAEVLVLVLAPGKLAALENVPWRNALPNAAHDALISWRFKDARTTGETARRLHANLIIDAGPVTPAKVAQADLVQRTSGIPYILVDDSFARMPQMMRAIGVILGEPARAEELSTYAEHAIAGLRGRLLIEPPDKRPRVYFAMGADGMLTPLPGSPAAAAIEEAGTVNVARPLGHDRETRVTPAQLRAWNPDIVIVENRAFYDRIRHAPGWRGIAAVRDGHVYLEPASPFGWIEDPSGVNRVIGLHWLSVLLYPGSTEEDLRTTVCDFYDKFYRIKLTNAAIQSLVGPAGVPPAELARPAELGPAPTTVLPPSMPSLPPGVPTPSEGLPSLNGLPTAPRVPGARRSVPGTMPNAPGMAGTESGVPGIPSNAPSAPCTVPTGPSPRPLTGLMTPPTPGVPGSQTLPPGLPPLPGTLPEATPPTPGAPNAGRPPGRRGRAPRQPAAPGALPPAGAPASPEFPNLTGPLPSVPNSEAPTMGAPAANAPAPSTK